MPRPDYVGMLEAERDRLREALEKGRRFERCYQESLGAVWTRPMQERLDSLQTAFLEAYLDALKAAGPEEERSA